jgi:hypothetical protein
LPWLLPLLLVVVVVLVVALAPSGSDDATAGRGYRPATERENGPTPGPSDGTTVPGTSLPDDTEAACVDASHVFGPGEHPPGCWRPYGPTSPFNRPIPPSPRLHPRSDEIVTTTLGLGPIAPSVIAPDTRRDWFHPIYFSTAADPVFTVHCTNPDWRPCEIEGMEVHIPDAARPAGGDDGHLAVIEQHTGWEYDLWRVADKPAGGGVITAEYGGRTLIDGDGLGSDATAAHFGLAAGVVRYEELADGYIDHALFLFVGCAADEPVPPATGEGAECADVTDPPAIGQLFWLDMAPAEIDLLHIAPWKRTILRALAEYGGYVGDTGGNEAFAIAFESASSYTSFGQPNPWLALQDEDGVSLKDDALRFDIAHGVDWAGRLRVIDPCEVTDECG